MPVEFYAIRCQDGSFRIPTEYDSEQSRKLKVGAAYKFTAVTQTARSLRHHRLFFGGLLTLGLEYWEPTNGLLTPGEISTLQKFSAWLDKKGGNSGAVVRASEVFLKELQESRANRIESPSKSIDSLLEWVKLEIGHYDLIKTPRGIIKKTRSINFNSLSQDDFNVLYRDAFSVIWRFILSRPFETEEEAQRAIDQLIAMG